MDKSIPWHRDWRFWTGLLLVVVIVSAAISVLADPIQELFVSREAVESMIRRAGIWGPLLIIGLEIAQALVIPIPNVAIELVSGYLFGSLWGTLYCAIGVLSGMALSLTLARRLGRPLVERLVPPDKLARLDELASQRGLFFFFMIFIIPFVPDDPICLMAGLSPLPLSLLWVAGVAGRLPGLVVANWAGAQGRAMGPSAWVVGALGICLLAFLSWRYQEKLETLVLGWIQRIASRRPFSSLASGKEGERES